MRRVTFLLLLLVFVIGAGVVQGQRPGSPRGEASTQFGGEYEGRRYKDGKWIVVDYSRPILRGRTGIFGEGETYGQKVLAGAPVWRAGANKSTRLMTEAKLSFGDKTLPAGEYSVFIDLKAAGWTLIFSNHKAKDNPRNPGDGLWGSYGYKSEMDVIRVPMTKSELPSSVDQLTYMFLNVDKTSGTLALAWEKTIASVNFKLAQ